MDAKRIARDLSRKVSKLDFAPPVTHVYNPLEYAWAAHAQFLERFARPGVRALLVGMNPGPFGMAQTGVPFGEVELVRDWIGIEADVERPKNEHPKRPIEGFACKRSEVSGKRLWGWARGRYGRPERFFKDFFVWNYCPLVFMEETGRNRTPDKLPAAEKEPLFEACNRALGRVVSHLEPEFVLGIGRFAFDRVSNVVDGDDFKLGQVLHPSPASPIANRGWAEQAERQLSELGVTS